MAATPRVHMAAVRRDARVGFTMIELLMSLAITALVAAAIAAMLSSVTHGTATTQDVRGLLVMHKALDARLGACVRSSHLVLATGSNYLVLWMNDNDADGVPNLSELRRVELDGSGNLWSYMAVFPNGYTQTQINAVDTAYPLTSDFNSVTTALKSNAYFQSQKWMTGVTSLTLTLDDPTAQNASYVSYRAVITAGGQSDNAIGAAAMRN